MAKPKKKYPPLPSFYFRQVIVVDGTQKLFLEVPGVRRSRVCGYLTTVSKNALTEAPIVIGPLELPKAQWLALAAYAKAIADLLIEPLYDDEHHRKSTDPPVLY